MPCFAVGDSHRVNNRNPFAMVREYIENEGLRLVDFFRKMDTDQGGSISRQEFVDGLTVSKFHEPPQFRWTAILFLMIDFRKQTSACLRRKSIDLWICWTKMATARLTTSARDVTYYERTVTNSNYIVVYSLLES